MKKLYFRLIVLFLIISCSRSFAQAPVISSFSPTSGPLGTRVTITGANFNTTTENNIVYFGATRAINISSTATTLTVLAPVGATYQPITVFNTETRLSASSKSIFITTFRPKKGSITYNDILPKVDFTTLAAPCAIAILDGGIDGKPDMFVVNDIGSSLSYFANNSIAGVIDSDSFLSQETYYNGGRRPQAIATGDLYNSGHPVTVIASYGDNSFTLPGTPYSFPTALAPIAIAVDDIDLDGKPDVIVANAYSFGISVFRNTTGSIGSAPSFAPRIDFTTGFQPVGLAIGDLDRDGKSDVIIINSNTDSSLSLSILKNTSVKGAITTSSFAPQVDFTTGLFPRSVALGDIDLDGKIDIVVANQRSNTISILRNTSSTGSISVASFASKVDYPTGFRPRSIAIGDMDGDGKPDIAVVNQAENTVSILRNTSIPGPLTVSSFAARVNFLTGVQPYFVAIGDIDGDGRPDMEVANYKSNTVSVFRNDPVLNAMQAQRNNSAAEFMQSANNTQTNIISLKEITANKLNATIYPTPAINFAKVEVKNAVGNVTVIVTDITGKMLWQSQKIAASYIEIPVSNLAAGMYMVLVKDAQHSTALKLIKD